MGYRDEQRFVLTTEVTLGEGNNEEMISRFLDECCTVGGRDRTQTKALWAAWRKWAKASDLVPGRQDDLTKRLAARGMATVLENDDLFVAGIVLRPGATRVCRYCHRLIVSETCDCRVADGLEGWEGPGEAAEERGGSLPPNKYAAPAAKWARTAPAGAGLRGSGELKASRMIERQAQMDIGTGRGNPYNLKARAWKDRFHQIPIPRGPTRLRNGTTATVYIGAIRDEIELSGDQSPVPFDDALLAALLKGCSKTFDGCRDAALLSVLRDTGAKLSELAALWIKDWNWEDATIIIRGPQARRVALSDATLERLWDYLPMRGTKLHASDRPAPDPRDRAVMWLARDGTRLTGSAIADLFQRRCRRSRLGDLHINQLFYVPSDQDFGAFHRIGDGIEHATRRVGRFESREGWVYLPERRVEYYGPLFPTPYDPLSPCADSEPEEDLLVGNDEKDDDAGPFEYFAGPSEEEEEAAEEEAYGLPAGTLAAERALETEADAAARLAVEADEIFQVWRQELKCTHCDGKGVLRKGLCDPCRQYQRRNRHLPPPVVLMNRGFRKNAPLAR